MMNKDNKKQTKYKLKELVSKDEFLEVLYRLDEDLYNSWVNDKKITEEEYDNLSARIDKVRDCVFKMTQKYNLIIISLIMTSAVEVISKVLEIFGIGG